MKKVKKSTFLSALLLLGIVAGLFMGGCADRPAFRYIDGSIWHTSYHIVYIPSSKSTPDLSDSVMAILRQVELSLSPFNNQSLISAVNRSESDSIRADELIESVFGISRFIFDNTAGAFDPTLGPIINAWGFGTAGRDTSSPSRSTIDSLRRFVGFDRCSIDSVSHTIRKAHPLTTFNFSAVTKGLACDRVIEMFRRNGVENCLVEIGGEIAVRGQKYDNQPWLIQLDMPILSDSVTIHNALVKFAPGDMGIATSGNYRNFRRIESQQFGHTIDPRSGFPAQCDIVSATVLHPSAGYADALATALMVIGSGDAKTFLRHYPEFSALLVVVDSASNSLRLIRSESFPDFLSECQLPIDTLK